MSIRTFLLDDHEVVRRGLRELIESQPDLSVVGEASTVAEAVRRIPATRPEVAIFDARLPDGSGIEACREIRSAYPQVQGLILTSFDDDAALSAAVLAGAAGYLLKDIRGNGLIEAIRVAATGRSLLTPAEVHRIRASWQPTNSDPRLDVLTPQERRILDLVAEGLTNREVGERLHLAEKTVKNYLTSILGKLGMERRTQAAVFAARYAS